MANSGLAALFCIVIPASHAGTISFANFTNLNLPSGTQAMNDVGSVAGFSNGSGFEKLPDGTLISPIAYPQGQFTEVFGLNNSGVLVGYYLGVGPHGFTYDAGTYTTISVNEGNIAAGINNRGDVIGFLTANLGGVGFLIQEGAVIMSGFPDGGDRGTFPTGINDADYIVGYYYGVGNETGGSHAFLRTPDGSFTSFDFGPGASSSGASAINNAGIIVGSYGVNSTNSTHTFVRFEETNYPFDPPGARDSYAMSITNNNQLFGKYFLPFDPNPHFFLVDVVTVPEPATWSLAGLFLLISGSRYSLRSATSGSTRIARIAGIAHAKIAVAARISATTAYVTGSVGRTSNN